MRRAALLAAAIVLSASALAGDGAPPKPEFPRIDDPQQIRAQCDRGGGCVIVLEREWNSLVEFYARGFAQIEAIRERLERTGRELEELKKASKNCGAGGAGLTDDELLSELADERSVCRALGKGCI